MRKERPLYAYINALLIICKHFEEKIIKVDLLKRKLSV